MLLYLSVPPESMRDMVGMLADTGLSDGARIILEKPFGRDLESARALNEAVLRVFPEQRVFRIDHFLGKEGVQAALALRIGNAPLDAAWDRRQVSSVQIDVPEDLGLEGRASFLESTGTFRDMVATHLCQLLGTVALEPPQRWDADSLRAERLRVFRALRPFDPARVVSVSYTHLTLPTNREV